MLNKKTQILSGKDYPGQQVLKRSPIQAILTANLSRDALKVNNLRKQKTRLPLQDEEDNEIMDASQTEELVADHEWESLLHTFDQEADETSPGVGGADSEDDIWERLSSTRWIKNVTPIDDPSVDAI